MGVKNPGVTNTGVKILGVNNPGVNNPGGDFLICYGGEKSGCELVWGYRIQ